MATAKNNPARLALITLAMAGAGVSAFWLAKAAVIFTHPESEWVAPLPVAAAAPAATQLPTLDTAFDAFHRATIETVVDTTIGEDAPETTLNLVLKGHRAGPNGSAIIQTPDRTQANFVIDDEIVPGVQLEAVYDGYVVIRRGTGLERLSNARETLFETPEVTSTSADATPPARVQTASRQPANLPDGVTAGVVPGDILQRVSLTRAVVNGQTLGYRVGERPGADLSAFGLQSGDVVTRINDIDMGSISAAKLGDVYERLARSSTATLEVVRDGSPITVRIGR